MKFAEINRRFTEKVAEYIAKGYTINTATMGGSQGEISKVDLTDGKEIIRVVLESMKGLERIGEYEFFHKEGIELKVLRASSEIKPHVKGSYQTIWNNDCTELFKEEFYQVDQYNWESDWYSTREEAISAHRIRRERYKASQTDTVVELELTNAVMKKVLEYVRRQPRCKSVRPEEIKVVRTATDKGMEYTIKVRGKSFKLG